MNIVLIILDTARGDTTNSLIQKNRLTNLAELADTGQYYTDARANAPWTVPSHGTIFTGEYPSDNDITGNDPAYESVPLVEELRSEGYTTATFSANPWISANFGFDSSFDKSENKYDYYPAGASMWPVVTSSTEIPSRIKQFASEMRHSSISKSFGNVAFWAYQRTCREDAGGKHLLSRAGDWLSKPSHDSKFAFINVTESHLPYKLPTEWLPDNISVADLENINQDAAGHAAGITETSEQEFRILRQIYAATLEYLDHLVGEFVAKAPEDTTFIIAGDHGEHFGEYSRFGHQYSLYKELIHVPLVISGPTVDQMKITETVELRELYEFILNLAEGTAEPLSGLDEHIAELVAPIPSVDTLQSKPFADLPRYVHQYGNGARCISEDGYKLIEFPDGGTKLVRENNTEEVIDDNEWRESLQQTLRERRGDLNYGESAILDVTDSVESRLKDLGYA